MSTTLSLILEFLFGTFEVFGTTFTALAVFRFPPRLYWKEALFVSIATSMVALIHYNFMDHPLVYNELSALMITFIMYKLLLKVSYWHALLFAVVGYLLLSVPAMLVLMVLVNILKVASFDQFFQETPYLLLLQTIIGFLLLFTGDFLYKKGLGYPLLSDKMMAEKSMRNVTMLLLASMIFSLVLMELAITKQMIPFHLLGLFSVNAVLWLLYKRSYKEMQEHYKRFDVAAMAKQARRIP